MESCESRWSELSNHVPYINNKISGLESTLESVNSYNTVNNIMYKVHSICYGDKLRNTTIRNVKITKVCMARHLGDRHESQNLHNFYEGLILCTSYTIT